MANRSRIKKSAHVKRAAADEIAQFSRECSELAKDWESWLPQSMLIIGLAVWVFWPSLRGGLIWDDTWYITTNTLLHDWSGLYKFWFQPGKWVEYYPVNESVIWLEYQLWGEHTPGYHRVTLALHIVGSLLFWQFLSKLGLRWAWLGGLLFAIHPVQVPSAAWLSELKNTLSLPFALLAMSAWVDFDKTRNTRDYRRALIFYVVSMLCKITMAPFSFVLLLYAWWKRAGINWNDLKCAAPFLVVGVGLAALTHFAGAAYMQAGQAQDLDIPLGGPVTCFVRAGGILWFYFALILFPVNMSPVYPLWQVDLGSLANWLPLLAAILLATWAWVKRRTWGRHLILGLGFFTLNLLPFLGFLAISYMSETLVEVQLLYLPLVGVIALVVAALGDIENKMPASIRYVPVGVAALGILACAWNARAYAGWFANEEVFWTNTSKRYPMAWLPYQDLGCYFIQVKRYPEAEAHLRRGVELLPQYDFGHSNLGIVLEKRHKLVEAESEYREALRLNPRKPDNYLNLGELKRTQGKMDEAEAIFRQGLQIVPDSEALNTNLAGILVQSGRAPEAISRYEEALKYNPDLAQVEYNLGVALQQTGDVTSAGRHFSKALDLDPKMAAAYASLGIVLAQTGQLSDAIAQFQRALELNPHLKSTRDNLAFALVQAGNIPEAMDQFRQALKDNPDDARAKDSLQKLEKISMQQAGRY